jgi:hypothetical protein
MLRDSIFFVRVNGPIRSHSFTLENQTHSDADVLDSHFVEFLGDPLGPENVHFLVEVVRLQVERRQVGRVVHIFLNFFGKIDTLISPQSD